MTQLSKDVSKSKYVSIHLMSRLYGAREISDSNKKRSLSFLFPSTLFYPLPCRSGGQAELERGTVLQGFDYLILQKIAPKLLKLSQGQTSFKLDDYSSNQITKKEPKSDNRLSKFDLLVSNFLLHNLKVFYKPIKHNLLFID